MKKSVILLIIFSLIYISFISAFNGYGYNFDLNDIFNTIEPQTIFLVTVFLVSFALFYFSLSKVFKENVAIAAIIAFSLALFLTYNANESGFDFEGLFYNLGIDSDMTFPVLSIAVLIAVILLAWQLGFGIMLIILGILFVLISLFAYERGVVSLAGAILILLGLFIAFKFPKQKSPFEIRLRK